jgi:hypothetical protein
VVALPLLMAGWFTAGLTIALFVPVAVLVLTFGLRAVRPIAPASWWAVAGVLLVAVVFCAFELVMCTQQIIIRRDPASYFQFATWLSKHGSLPIPQSRWAFGGGDPALSFDSPAFYARGDVLVPQFMAGMPLIAAVGGWIGGPLAMLGVAPVIGALAVLSFGGLVTRLVGARWAPLGALALALTFPMMMVSRSTYSEPAAMVLLLGGLTLTINACHRYTGTRRDRAILALLGGLALGLTELVRIDGLSDVLPVVAFAGLLFASRRPGGLPLITGLSLGTGAGLVEGYLMSRPYLATHRDSLYPLLLIAGAVTVGTVLMVILIRWKGLPDPTRRRLPELAFTLPIVVMIAFAVRPLAQTVRRVPHTLDDQINATFIASVQKSTGLPVDGTRQYSELSLQWVIWYIGLPALLLATIGAAVLVRRILYRQASVWLLPYALITWSTITALWRPAITPDHPWASRRLIAIVIPGLLLLAVWALDWARPGDGRRTASLVVAAGMLLILTPPAVTSARAMLTKTDQGEVAQARAMCRAIGQQASVLIVDQPTGDKFTELIRGMCGQPTGRAATTATSLTASPEDVRRIIANITSTGRHPIVLGFQAASVSPYGTPRRVFYVNTRQDTRTLVTAPTGTRPFTASIWMADAALT